MKLNEHELEEIVGEDTTSKGFDYFKRGKVLKCKVLEETKNLVLLKSEVASSGTKTYNQHIKLSKPSNSKLQISGGCSCPVGFNCKHVLASCLEYIINLQTKQSDDEVNIWLEKIVKSSTKEKLISDHVYSEYFLIYRVFNTSNSYYKEDLKFYKSKILKNGTLSKGTKINSENLLYSYSYQELVNYQDKEILDLAKAIIPKYTNESQELKGELGAIVFKKMIDTKRCFYKDSNTPLSMENNKKDIVFSWKDLDGFVKLESNISDDFKFLNTTPLMAIDTNSFKVYQFNQNIKGDIVSLLENSPLIPNEKVNEVYEFLSSSINGIELPVPSSYKLKKISTKPIPVLNLYRNEKDGYKFHSMHLDFAYGDFLISHFPLDEKLSFLQDETKIEIIRDIKSETESISYLENLGFSKYVENGVVYFLSEAKPNMQTALNRWREFLTIHCHILKEKNWDIKIDDSFTMKFDKTQDIILQTKKDNSNDWFELSFDIELNGISRPLANLIAPLLKEFVNFENLPDTLNIEIEDNHFLELDKKEIEPVLKTIFALIDKKDENGNLKVSTFEAHIIEDMDKGIEFKGSKELIELSKKLKDFKGLEKVPTPKALNATLREYQQDGLNWLGFLHDFRFGGILADDMGLGKTIQTITHLSSLKEQKRLDAPSVIIMPTSLIANWKNEIKKFSSNLSVLSLHGNKRLEKYEVIDKYDIVLTTYNLIVRDFELLKKKEFYYIILDEAQKIKNPKTKMALAIKSLNSKHRLALSGTPVENHLGELWSIFSFVMPGFLSSYSDFKKDYQTLIEKEKDTNKQKELNNKIKPFMLRRTKDEVVSELPPKSEIIKYTQFESKQSKLYETIRVTMEKKVKEIIEQKGLNGSHITILDALLKLRQVCCDPSLLQIDEAKKVKDSAKLELFLDLVDELLSEGKKILVFSQFTSMLSIIEKAIEKKDIKYTKLTGSTTNREDVINEFKDGKADIFLISLKAGGVGLNLVEADTVIHYDPWWNPAVENQATDRAYRIGQTKAVFVYKLIVENTIEQKIIELQKKKQTLQDNIYDDEIKDEDIFNGSELLELLKN